MEFKTAPAIIDALVKRAKIGLMGFTLADDKYLSSIRWWMKNMRDWEIEKDWIVPIYGTIHSVATAIRAFTEEGDGVIYSLLSTTGMNRQSEERIER
jgi:cystathionine beta-lyase